ncbi:MAG: helicase C-terminal domain-containing protein [Promethearchaeota archaeon]
MSENDKRQFGRTKIKRVTTDDALINYILRKLPEFKDEILDIYDVSERTAVRIKAKNRRTAKKNLEKRVFKLEKEFRVKFSLEFKSKFMRLPPTRHQYYFEKISPFDLTSARGKKQRKVIIDSLDFLIEKNERIVLKAHNGFGKTLTVLLMLCEFLRKNPNWQVVYFCKTHSQIQNTLKEIKRLPDMRAIPIRARNETCFDEKLSQSTDSIYNMFACGKKRQRGECEFHNNLMFTKLSLFNLYPNEIVQKCKEKKVCAYHAIKNKIKSANIILLTYAQFFNRIAFRGLMSKLKNAYIDEIEIPDKDEEGEILRDEFGEVISKKIKVIKTEKTFFVFDECHNLSNFQGKIDDMNLKFSNRFLDRNARINAFRHPSVKEFENVGRVIAFIFNRLKDKFEYQRTHANAKKKKLEIAIKPEERKKIALEACERLKCKKADLLSAFGSMMKKKNMQLYHYANYFYSFFENIVKEDIYTSIKLDNEGNHVLTFLNLRFDKLLRPIENNPMFFMSGTLNIEKFIKILWLKGEIKKFWFPYSYPEENRKIYVINDLDSSYGKRELALYRRFGQFIFDIVSKFNGKSAVFFSSYLMRKLIIKNSKILKRFLKGKKNRVFREEKRNTSLQNDELVANFKKSRKGILLGINGGRNSEGVDFKDAQIKLILLIGLPITPPSDLSDAYAGIFGYEEVYYLPAVEKTSQTIGRAIRGEDQKAVIIICDTRFRNNSHFYKNLELDLKNFRLINASQAQNRTFVEGIEEFLI